MTNRKSKPQALKYFPMKPHSASLLPSALALVALALSSCATAPVASTPPSPWDAVPAILARIKAPQFPAKDFPITDYGAKADGTTDCTDAIAQAIAACN